MPYKNRTWGEIRDDKPLREWRRINKIYGKRHHLRNLLKKEAAELLERIHNIRIIQTPGPADALRDRVHRALHLPYAWNQEDYDHACSLLAEVAAQVAKYENREIPKNGDLANTLIMFIRKAEDSDGEKGAALIQCLRYMADKIGMTNIEKLENTEANYLLTLLRSPNGYYPDWFMERLFQTVITKLKQEDYLKLQEKITLHQQKLREEALIMSMFAPEPDDDVMVIG